MNLVFDCGILATTGQNSAGSGICGKCDKEHAEERGCSRLLQCLFLAFDFVYEFNLFL